MLDRANQDMAMNLFSFLLKYSMQSGQFNLVFFMTLLTVGVRFMLSYLYILMFVYDVACCFILFISLLLLRFQAGGGTVACLQK